MNGALGVRRGAQSWTEEDGSADLDGWSAADLQITAVSSHGWRVSDRRRPPRDPLHLLAFIERRGSVFEVLQLGTGFEWHEFDSFDAAVGHVLVSSPRCARVRRYDAEGEPTRSAVTGRGGRR